MKTKSVKDVKICWSSTDSTVFHIVDQDHEYNKHDNTVVRLCRPLEWANRIITLQEARDNMLELCSMCENRAEKFGFSEETLQILRGEFD